jgi:hypothetical protein
VRLERLGEACVLRLTVILSHPDVWRSSLVLQKELVLVLFHLMACPAVGDMESVFHLILDLLHVADSRNVPMSLPFAVTGRGENDRTR